MADYTIGEYQTQLTESMYLKFKLFSFDNLIRQIEECRVNQHIFWEEVHYKFSMRVAALKFKTAAEFTKDNETDYNIINDMFGIGPAEAKELLVKYMEELIAETKNMFTDALLIYLKDYVRNHLPSE